MPRMGCDEQNAYPIGRDCGRFFLIYYALFLYSTKILQAVCQCGYAVSIGGLDIDKLCISVPVRRTGKKVSGSICLILTKVRYGTSNAELLAELMVDVAGKISDRINARGSPSKRPAVADCRNESV